MLTTARSVRGAPASPIRRAARPLLQPRVAIIGFGMAGVGCANALRNWTAFASSSGTFAPEIVVLEASRRVRGKVCPDNAGAQFLDARGFYPMDRYVREFGLSTCEPRQDYNLAPFTFDDGRVLEGVRFAAALRTLREAARAALRTEDSQVLDRMTALEFIERCRSRAQLDGDQCVAMVARLGQEEGTTNVSALAFCINLGKGDTPMERVEVVGGPHLIVEAERQALRETGARLMTEARVRRVAVGPGVTVSYDRAGPIHHETFDAAVLAVAPEHLGGIQVLGSSLPLDALACLQPATITKTNLVVRRPPPERETCTSRHAMWLSPGNPGETGTTTLTFFHGYDGQPALALGDMMEAAYGDPDTASVVRVDSQAWDPAAGSRDVPHGYTTIPTPGRGQAVVDLALDQFFGGRFDGERLWVANHVVGLGCYTRDAALAGEWAAVALMRSCGLDVGRAMARVERPAAELLGLVDPTSQPPLVLAA